MKKVSVIIPVYNYEQFVGEAIESVLNQTYPHMEVIAVNDGSTDGTKEVLTRYGNKIKILEQMNAGQSAARNHGIRKAEGDYICFLDADDLFLPQKVEYQMHVFQQSPKTGLVHTGAVIQRKNDNAWEDWYTYIPPNHPTRDEQISNLLQANFIVNSTVMVKREILALAGTFNEHYAQAEDYDMWLRILKYCSFGAVQKVLLRYRWHGKNLSGAADNQILPVIQEEARKRFYQ